MNISCGEYCSDASNPLAAGWRQEDRRNEEGAGSNAGVVERITSRNWPLQLLGLLPSLLADPGPGESGRGCRKGYDHAMVWVGRTLKIT